MMVDNRQAQRVAFGLSALFAVVGIACVVLFLHRHTPDAHLLFGATISATASVAALMAGVFHAVLESLQRDAPADAHHGRQPGRRLADREAAVPRPQRREVVPTERRSSDEPRFCTQAQAPCTRWSSCGGQSPGHFAVVETADARSYAGPIVLPVVHRHGMQDCPLMPRASTAGRTAAQHPVIH